MTTTETEQNTTEETEEQQCIRERFEQQEKKFQQQEKKIADMRAWLERNRERLGHYGWSICDRTVNFYSFLRSEGQQKDIARAFGKDGWKREKDDYTCGAIHWVKEFDGATLKIHEAEIVKLNPIDEVKL